MPQPVFVVGDVHGHRDALVRLLRAAGLVDGAERWSGGDSRLWLMGDLVDRGPDGIGAIDLVMRLERESGGAVRCLLGNHETMLLATAAFDDAPVWGRESFRDVWRWNGGRESDLAGLTPAHRSWIAARPALAREGETLLLHADTDRYLEYGSSVETIVRSIAAVLGGRDADAFTELLDVVSDRYALRKPNRLDRLLAVLGGTSVVHGHTPIFLVRGVEPEEVVEPLAYAGGRALNVDHCLFAGGPGFVTRLA